MTPDRRNRILRTAFQAGVGGLVATLAAVANVVGEGKEVWAPITAGLLTVLVSALQNYLDARKDKPAEAAVAPAAPLPPIAPTPAAVPPSEPSPAPPAAL